MSRKELFGDELVKILTVMCEYAGVDYNDVDFDDEEWYMRHKWNEQQMSSFEEWMYIYLLNHRKAREAILATRMHTKPRTAAGRERLKKAVTWWLFNYGWSRNDYK